MPVSGIGPYDDGNIFARLLRGEIPSRRVYEDEFAVAFHDIAPQAPIHILVVPRGRWVSLADFSAGASDAEIAGFFRAVGAVAAGFGATGLPGVGQCRRGWWAGGAAFPRSPVWWPVAVAADGDAARGLMFSLRGKPVVTFS